MKIKNTLFFGVLFSLVIGAAGFFVAKHAEKHFEVDGGQKTYTLDLDCDTPWTDVHDIDEHNKGASAKTKLGNDVAFRYSNKLEISDGSGLITFPGNADYEFRNVDPLNGLIKMDYKSDCDFNLSYGFRKDDLRYTTYLTATGHSWDPAQTFTFDCEYGYPTYFKIDSGVSGQIQELKFYYNCVPSIDPYRHDGDWEYTTNEGGEVILTGYHVESGVIPDDKTLTVPNYLKVGNSYARVSYIAGNTLSTVPWVEHIILPFVGQSWGSDVSGYSHEFGSIFRKTNSVGDVDYVAMQQNSNTWYVPKNLKTVTLYSANKYQPTLAKVIPNYAFYGAEQLTEINILGPRYSDESVKDKVSEIGIFAFANCRNLKELYLPRSITNISYSAFAGDSNLIVRCYGTVGINDSINPNYAKVTENYLETVTYHDVKYDLYKSGDNTYANALGLVSSTSPLELDFNENVVVGDKSYEVKRIANRAFSDVDTLQRVYIPEGMEQVGHLAFKGAYRASIILEDELNEEVYLSDFDRDTGVVVPGYTGGDPIEEHNVIYLPLKSGGYFADHIYDPYHESLLLLDRFESNLPIYVSAYFAESNNDITILYIPKNITLGDSCFLNCSNLSVVHFVGTVDQWNALVDAGKIGANCFAGTQVEEVICSGGRVPV